MTIGDRLREAREARKVTLHEIAERTNISVRFLDALEKGHVDKLPGGIFTRGFVRSYATQVGLDPDDTVKAFVAAHPQIRTDDDGDDSPQRSAMPTLALIIGVLLVLAALAAGGYWWVTRPVSAVAAETSSVARATSPPASVVTAGVLPEDTPAAPAALPPPPLPAPADTASPQTAPAEQAAVSTLPLRLTVSPTGQCWVQVKADGRVRLAREVLPGERVDIEAEQRLEIVAGDAGTFAYQLNGRAGRGLGAAGKVGRATITTASIGDFQAPDR